MVLTANLATRRSAFLSPMPVPYCIEKIFFKKKDEWNLQNETFDAGDLEKDIVWWNREIDNPDDDGV